MMRKLRRPGRSCRLQAAAVHPGPRGASVAVGLDGGGVISLKFTTCCGTKSANELDAIHVASEGEGEGSFASKDLRQRTCSRTELKVVAVGTVSGSSRGGCRRSRSRGSETGSLVRSPLHLVGASGLPLRSLAPTCGCAHDSCCSLKTCTKGQHSAHQGTVLSALLHKLLQPATLI
jgi:hypothetical protein